MEFDTLIFLLAAGYALLQWMIRGIRKASGQAGGTVEQPGPSMEQAELEVRRRQRLERLQQRRLERIEARQRKSGTASSRPLPPVKTHQERQVEQFQRTLEELLGVRSERGPMGRQGGVELEPAEDIEELETLEEEPIVTSLETGSERAPRVVYDQDAGAEALVQRRILAAEARSGGLTRVDHERFDKLIRAPSQPLKANRPQRKLHATPGSIRDAFVWAEILGPPVARR